MSVGTGGQAFPRVLVFTSRDGEVCSAVEDGMTLRDYFAAKAMQGLASDPSVQETAEEMAALAYALADAMLAAREAK